MDRQEYKTQNSKRDSERQARIEKEANTVNWLHFWRWRPTWWNVPSEKFAFLVALFTGVLAVVAYKQLTATQGQLTEMQIQSAVTRTQLRANLKLTMANYVINNDGKAFAWIFTPVWKNAGTTEALRANGWDDSQSFPNDAPEKFDFLHPRNKLPDVPFAKSIPQGDELMSPTRSLTVDEMKNITDNKGQAVIWGHMEYDDVFPHTPTHHIHYCLRIYPANISNIVSFPLYRPECNFSD
jgi:hypothetical protein